MNRVLLCAGFLLAWVLSVHAKAESPVRWQPLGEPGSGGTIVSLSVDPRDSHHLLIGGDMLGVGFSTDGGLHWQASTGFSCFEDGSFTWHPTDPTTVWIGTMAGPCVSHDGGVTWQSKRAGFPPIEGIGYHTPVEKILFDPKDSSHQHLLAVGGSSRHWDCGPDPLFGVIWESTDAGEHWKRLITVTTHGSDNTPTAKGANLWIAEYAAGSSDIIYGVADGAGLLISENGGRTWQVRRGTGLPRGTIVNRIAFSPVDPLTMWGCIADHRANPDDPKDLSLVPGGVFKSIDGGKTWTDSSAGLVLINQNHENQVSRFEAITVSPANPDVLYVSDTAWNTGVIYKSEDAGKTWRAVATKNNIGQTGGQSAGVFAPQTAYFAGLSMTTAVCDPKNPDVAYFINTEFVLRTIDGGKTFDDLTSEKLPNGNWRGRGYSGLCAEHFGFNPFRRGQSIAMGMDASRCWLSDDDLQSWTYPLKDPNPWFGGLDCSFTRDGHIFTTSGQYGFWGIGRSANGGKNWQVLGGQKIGLPEMRMGGGRGSEGIYANPDDARHVWTVAEWHLYRSIDGGDHWTRLRTPSSPHFIAGDPKHPDQVWISSDKNLYFCEDGEHFQLKGGPKPAGRIHFDSLGRLYVCSYESARGGLWRFTPGTEKWERLRNDAQIMDVAIDPVTPGRIAVATNMMTYTAVQRATGVWISADAGLTWAQENTGLAVTRGGAVAFDPFDPETLIFGSFGRGFFKASWPNSYQPVRNLAYHSNAADERFAAVDESDGRPKPILLRNGDMTEGTDLPTGWDGKWGGVKVTRDTAIFKSAPASLSVATVGDHSTGQASQMVDVTGGQTIRVSGAVKSSGNVKVNFAIQSYDDHWQAVGFAQVRYVQNDTDWSVAEKDVQLPENAVHIGVILLVEGNGKAWLDDVTAQSLPTPPAKN